MNVYFLSGLGADRRVFGRIVLPSYYTIRHLNWITPLHLESLPQYAMRLAKKIDTTKPFCLVGLSLGGMLAVEIAKQMKPEKTLLISSIATNQGLPPFYKLLDRLRIERAVPAGAFKIVNWWVNWYFGAFDALTKTLLRNIIRDSDARFNKWGSRAILRWTNVVRPANLSQIHGSSDRVLPIRYVRADKVIKGGGHLMVWTHGAVVSEWLVEKLRVVSGEH